jgi:trehalose 6-phosphate synthase/phosphatase
MIGSNVMAGERSAEGRLVVLSNRLPFTVREGRRGPLVERSSGGLVAALEPVIARRGGTWIGWPGGAGRAAARLPEPTGYRLVPVQLREDEVRLYYYGFSNRTLWPLLHSFPTRMQLDAREWLAYEAVNQRFAHLAAEAAAEPALVWIHDYQLMRAPAHLRRVQPDARIAFFLHVPFPPYDLFRILPWDRELLRGLLACDLVGFHCPGYAANFFDCAERSFGLRVDRTVGQVEYGARTVSVGSFALGIDYALVERRARAAAREEARPDERMVLGVDRLDYTKGIPERLRAFVRLLELHPEHRGRVVLVQIAEPSRGEVAEYQRLKRQVNELVGEANGRFGSATWTPIRYVNRSVGPDELAGLYRRADVALVTPLRDGMNLVAKEYVASQVGDPGVLVLSRLAGAAESMREALQVNPYNVDAVAEALHQALTMGAEERTARMRALQRRERRQDVHAWVETFLRAASAPTRIRPFRPEDAAAWLGAELADRRLALFLDFDGTLAPIVEHPDQAALGAGMRAALAACASRDDTEVAIVSGRALADVRARIDLPGVAFAGNHGLEIEAPGIPPLVHPDLAHFEQRSRELAAALRGIAEPGVWLEEKGASLTLHYRRADAARHGAVAERARALVRDAGFQARDALCAVEARPPIGWDKGRAVLHLLRERHGPAWSEAFCVVYVGDDDTDEDAFHTLLGLGVTFRVGRAERPTLAVRRLPDVEAVEALLRWIAERPAPTPAPEPAGARPA